MKKITFILCIALLLTVFAPTALAKDYGSSTNKLLITHINVNYAEYEGSGVIYSSSTDGTLKPYGTFNWWNVVVFKWDNAEKCYVVESVNTAMNVSKETTKIPANGFVYCCNTGNDYPALGDNSKPNYTTKEMNDTCAFVSSVKTGDKAFLYGADLLNGVVDTNGELWYEDNYESNAFIKIGSEESGLKAYNPETATEKKPTVKLGVNAINGGIGEGQSMILTPSYAKTISEKNNNYSWCTVAVFDWSEKDNAYVLISRDTSVGNGMQKNAIIPPNGFAVSVNKGNNYPALGDNSKPNYVNQTATTFYDKIATIEIGSKVYLEGIDLAKNTIKYEGDARFYYDSSKFKTKAFLVFGDEKPENCYIPDTKNHIPTPEIINTDEFCGHGDLEIKWNKVEGASKYFVSVLNSTINTNGANVITKETTDTFIKIPKASLNVGSKYTVNLYATSNSGASSVAVYDFVVCSERALNSPFKGKTVVAFGDSITAWKGWVSMMYGEIGTDVINSGVGGDTTVHALNRIQKDVIEKNPDLVIVNFGMNDQAINPSTGKNLTPIEKYEENYRAIIDKILATGSEIILVAVHDVCDSKYGGGAPTYNAKDSSGVGYVDRFNEVVKKLADEYELGFLDINSLAEKQLDSMILDGIHLNDKGQENYCKWISDYCFEYAKEINFGSSNSDNSSENVSDDVSDNVSDTVSDNDISNDTPSTSDVISDSEEVSDEASDSTATSSDGMSSIEIAIATIVMFIGISVIGVMFIKIIKKNKQ